MQIEKAKLSQVAKLYDQFIEPNFTENEKKPLSSILRMMETGLYQVLYGCEQGQIVVAAFLVTYPNGKLFLLDYLAVDKNCRGKGYGGRMLKECSSLCSPSSILIETENVDFSESHEDRRERLARYCFYQGNGAVMTPIKTCIFDCHYNIWLLSDSTDASLSEAEIQTELTNLYHFIVPNPDTYKAKVLIPCIE